MFQRIASLGFSALLAASMCCGRAAATEEGATQEKKKFNLQFTIGDDLLLSPIVGPMYTPEMDFALALGGLMTFSTNKADTSLPRSTVSAFVIYSTNSSFTLSSFGDTFWKQDRLRFDFAQWYKDMPDNYWGVGYDNAVDVPEGDETTAYNRVWFEFTPELTWRIAGDFFVGVNANLNRTQAEDVAPRMAQDPDFIRDGDDVAGAGIGLTLRFDTRDVTVNSYRGRLFKATTTHFRDALGSDDDYDVYTIDYRQYHALGRPGKTLAWQLYGRIADGDVPWNAKSGVGSPFDLRGYTWGRFRDDAAVWGLVEYRHMFTSKLRKHGWATWVGLGFIGEDLGDLGGHDLPNAGVGWRWELQPRRNLRVDLGVGRNDAGFYLSMNESF